jgi:nucleoside-diphosphate-sugar epimerase
MKVLVIGATGAVGTPLVSQLVERGHEVVGTSRTRERAEKVRGLGAEPAVLDVLDREAVRRLVLDTKPDAIVHQATALAGGIDFRHFGESFAQTNRLRTEGTDNLLAAAWEAGVPRFVAQSYAGWPHARVGGPIKTEEDPLDDHPPEAVRDTLAAIKHLEAVVVAAGGIALRYGAFYGAPVDPALDAIRERKVPIVGDGGGIFSFVHVVDAASATVLALERGDPGIYNVTDDEPAPARDVLPALAEAVGAKPPRKVPVWLARLFAGELGVIMGTQLRGASNAKAKRELGWRLRYPSWRQGFAAEARVARAA